MKNKAYCFFAGFMLIVSLFCALSSSTIQADADIVDNDNTSIVTFDYNIDRIINYLPPNASMLASLDNYSITVQNGEHPVQTSKPMNQVLFYYTYKWTLNGVEVNLNDIVVNQDITLIAKWTPKDYHVYYMYGDVDTSQISNLQETVTFNVESPRFNLYIPNLHGHRFTGWFDGASLISHLYIPARAIGDKVFYASFKTISYYIDFGLDTENNLNPTRYDVLDEDIVLTEATKKGHIFKGWYTDNKYQNPISIIDCSIGGNIRLYAKWEAKEYTVTYILPDTDRKETVSVKYGQKAALPKMNKSIFEIAVTDVSRRGITEDTTIHIKYVNIWYVYIIVALGIGGIVYLIISIKKKRALMHNRLRQSYQSNTNKYKRKY